MDIKQIELRQEEEENIIVIVDGHRFCRENRLFDLLYCVRTKWQGENREQTAKRYIQERELIYFEQARSESEPSFHGENTETI